MCDARSSLSWYLGNWIHNTLVVGKTIWGTMFIANNKVVVVNIACTIKGVTSYVWKGFWENNPSKSRSTSLLLSLLLPTFSVCLPPTFFWNISSFPITHSSDPKALTLGYGVVKPNVSALIEFFRFSHLVHPIELIGFFFHLVIKTFLQFSCLCCWYYVMLIFFHLVIKCFFNRFFCCLYYSLF